MNKPQEIEGFWDTFLIRPLGFVFVYLFRTIKLSPSQVSILSVIATWIAAFFYYTSERHGGIVTDILYGLLFFIIASAWDSADGQLARLTGQVTKLGRTIDGFCDNLGFVGLYLAILLGYSHRLGAFQWDMFFIGAIAGISHSTQSALTDYQRVLYLYYVYQKPEVIEESPTTVLERFKKAQTTLQKILLGFHLNYANQQRWFCSSSYELEKKITHLIAAKKITHADITKIYRNKQKRLLKLWAFLGSNTHKIGIILVAFLPVAATNYWMNLGMAWYYIYEIVLLNLFMLGLILWQKKTDKQILKEIESLQKK